MIGSSKTHTEAETENFLNTDTIVIQMIATKLYTETGIEMISRTGILFKVLRFICAPYFQRVNGVTQYYLFLESTSSNTQLSC